MTNSTSPITPKEERNLGMTANKLPQEMTEPQEVLLPADPMVSMIERVAMDPNADIEKLERMLAMKERMEAAATQKSFNEALAAAQAEMPNVIARHDNDQTKSKYADLADIYEVCKPVAAKHGFSFNAVPVAGGRDGFINMKWTLRRGAHIETDISEVPIDASGMKGTKNKTDTHAYGSTTSYGRRYLFCSVFDIAVGTDNDGNTGGIDYETVSAEQYVVLRDLIEITGTDEVKFHKAYGHDHPENADLKLFPLSKFEAAKAQLERKLEKEKGNV